MKLWFCLFNSNLFIYIFTISNKAINFIRIGNMTWSPSCVNDIQCEVFHSVSMIFWYCCLNLSLWKVKLYENEWSHCLFTEYRTKLKCDSHSGYNQSKILWIFKTKRVRTRKFLLSIHHTCNIEVRLSHMNLTYIYEKCTISQTPL